MRKTIGIILIIGGLLFAILRGVFHVNVYFEYQNKIESYWDLSDKSSTIVQKSEYLDKFVAAIEKEKLYGTYDALFYPNSSNSFDENFKALKSLQKRFKDISSMNENSFAYQTAMQQITAQEQGEAQNMLGVLSGCWNKVNHYTDWNGWIIFGFFLVQFIMVVLGFVLTED